MGDFFYKKNLALILAALVLGQNAAQVHAISMEGAAIVSASGLVAAGLTGYVIYSACGKNKMTEDKLESEIKSVLAEFKTSNFEKKSDEKWKNKILSQLTNILSDTSISLPDIEGKIKNKNLAKEDIKLILSKITDKNIQKLVNVFIPAELSSRVKLEHVDDNLKKAVDLLLNIEGFKVGITSDVLFNLLVLVLTIVVSKMSESDEQSDYEEKSFDLSTNTLKLTIKIKDEWVKLFNTMISFCKQLNSSGDFVKLLGTVGIPDVGLLDSLPIEPLLKGIKNIDFKLQNSLSTSFTWNSDESLTIKFLNGDDVMLQWSIRKA